MILIQLLDDIMAKSDEQHVSGELSRVEEAGTEDTTSTSTKGTTSTSIDDVEKEAPMEDFLELEEWLEEMDQNSEKKFDDD